MARKDAIKLALVLAAIGLAAYGTWRVTRSIELQQTLAMYPGAFFYPENPAEIVHLLELGADPNTRRHGDGNTVVHEAVRKRDVEAVRVLLEHGADPARANDLGTRPIAELRYGEDASYHNRDLAIAKLLWAHGEEYTFLDAIGAHDDAKVLADLQRDPSLAKQLLPGREWPGQNITALMAAVVYRSQPVIDLLLAAGADVNAVDDTGANVMWYAARSLGTSEGLLARLAELGAELDTPNRYGVTPLLIALLAGNAKAAEFFFQRGADVNRTDRNGIVLVWHVVRSGLIPDMLPVLADHGADLTARDENGNNLIAGIVMHQQYVGAEWMGQVITLLLSKGVSLDDVNNAGESAREWALNKFTEEELAELEREAAAIGTKSDAGDNELKPE